MDAGSSRRHEEHVCLIILIPTVISLCVAARFLNPSLPCPMDLTTWTAQSLANGGLKVDGTSNNNMS